MLPEHLTGLCGARCKQFIEEGFIVCDRCRLIRGEDWDEDELVRGRLAAKRLLGD